MRIKLHQGAATSLFRLRTAIAGGSSEVEVDPEAGTIKNVAVMTIGPALGHGFEVDQVTLQQLVACINDGPPIGVVSRFKHPIELADGSLADGLGTDVGRLSNARIVGNQVRGDIKLGAWAKSLPGIGDVWSYLTAKAKDDPTGFGLSAVIAADMETISDAGNARVVARIKSCEAVDFVGEPAANPNGLLSKTKPAAASAPAKSLETKGVIPVNENIRKVLIADFELPADATVEAAQALWDSLTDEQKKQVEDKAAAMEGTSESVAASKKKPAGHVTLQTQAVSADDQLLGLATKRVTQITSMGNMLKVPEDVIRLAVGSGDTLAQAQTRMLKWVQDNCKPANIRVGEDANRESIVKAIPDAIQLRAGGVKFYKFDSQGRIERDANGVPITRKPHERAQLLRGFSVLDQFRQYLIALGVTAERVMSYDRVRLAEFIGPRRFRREFPEIALAQGTSDFDSILADVQNKTLQQAYVDKPASWTIWARRATAPDFKNINRTKLSDAPALQVRNEAGEFTQVTLSDSKETYYLTEYGHVIRLTRKAIINDDLDAFNRIPQFEAGAARRKEDDLAYAVLTANAAMSDTVALFHGSHANLEATTANVGAPSVTTLASGRKKMRLQTGPKGAYLNLTPKFLIVPASLETVAEQYVSAAYVAAIQTSINPFGQNGSTPLRPVVEARLDANSTTVWYMAADYNEVDTIEVSFLDGEPEPVLKQETDFDTDDQKFAVHHTAAAAAIDHRGLYKNPGA